MNGYLGSLARRCMRPQFSLRAMFIAVTLSAAWLGVNVHHARDQEAAVQAIREGGGTVYYDFQECPAGSTSFDPEVEAPFPDWLVASLGVDLLSDVVFVELGGEQHKDSDSSPDSAIEQLPALRELRHLSFGDTVVTDAWLCVAGRLKKLEGLYSFEDTIEVTDAGMSHLGDLEKLKTLYLERTSITDESLRTLGRLGSLEELWLAGARVTDRGLAHLRNLTNLKVLRLGGRARITDRGLSTLRKLSRIQELDLAGGHVTAAGVGRLSGLQGLRSLDLSDHRELGDDALYVIGQFRRLEELRLGNTAVTSSGIERLVGLTKLKVLDISGNEGVDEVAIAHLRKLVGLEEIYLSGTRVKFTRANAGALNSLPALGHLEVAETGSNCRAIQAVLPSCAVFGARSETRMLTSRFDDDIDYNALESEIVRRERERLAIKRGKAGSAVDLKVSEIIVSPKLLPPQRTLRRMMAITTSDLFDPAMAAQQRDFIEHAAALKLQAGQDGSPNNEARSLLTLARSNALAGRLYNAAVDFQLADLLLEHLKYLDGVRHKCGLTDVEEDEYHVASRYLDACLVAASQQLGLCEERFASQPNDAVTRVWNETRRVAMQVSDRIPVK